MVLTGEKSMTCDGVSDFRRNLLILSHNQIERRQIGRKCGSLLQLVKKLRKGLGRGG
jgi:hypothetical protein